MLEWRTLQSSYGFVHREFSVVGSNVWHTTSTYDQFVAQQISYYILPAIYDNTGGSSDWDWPAQKRCTIYTPYAKLNGTGRNGRMPLDDLSIDATRRTSGWVDTCAPSIKQ